jgi:uncharacterized protein DUF6491
MNTMKYVKSFATLAVVSVAALGAAQAERSKESNALAGYEKTGDVVRCLPLTQVRDSDPIDDTAILFKMRGGKMYLNELNGKCSGLKRNDRFSFKTTQNQICTGDIITVADPVGLPVGSCGLGTFEALAEIQEDAE